MNAIGLNHLGPVIQLGYVTQDMQRDLEFWTQRMGVGPFFRIEHVALDGARYRGVDCAADFSTAFAYWGDMQVELIEQHNDVPSVFREPGAHVGIHHICIQVEDLEATRAKCLAMGGTVVHEAWMNGAGHFIYVDTAGRQPLGGVGALIEFAQLAPAFNGLFAYMRKASKEWDGSEPVRAVPPPSEWHE